jgi:ribosomal protein S18 acetylase RimI-like enzyme
MLELVREQDLPEVNRLALQVHELHVSWRPDIYCHTDAVFSLEDLMEYARERRLFVAKLQGQIVGFVLFRIRICDGTGIVPRKILMLEAIAVDAPLRGHGIGSRMMEELRLLAAAFGCTDLQLSVYPQNDEAVSFYQKCGFTIQSIQMQRKARET